MISLATNRRSAAFLLAILIIHLMSCVDTIELGPPIEDQRSLAIQGVLIKGNPNKIQIEVKRVFGYKSGNVYQNVLNVQLTNDLGQVRDIPRATLIGNYEDLIAEDDPEFEVRYQGGYQLRVETVDGRIYETNFEPLNAVPRVDSISTAISEASAMTANGIEIKNDIQFKLHTPLSVEGNPEKSRINWEMEKTFKISDKPAQQGEPSKTCYITDNLDVEEVAPVNANEFEEFYLADYDLININVNYQFYEGFYLNVYQRSLSEGAQEYFKQISRLVERTGNMLENPVGEIVSNFKNINDPEEDVYGYFYVTEIDTVHVKIEPARVLRPLPGRYCPPELAENAGSLPCPFDFCCDCLIPNGSTTIKPDYWDF